MLKLFPRAAKPAPPKYYKVVKVVVHVVDEHNNPSESTWPMESAPLRPGDDLDIAFVLRYDDRPTS